MSRIINLNTVKEKKLADLFAKDMESKALNTDLILATGGLSMVLGYVDKIVYFSGDVEEGKHRRVNVCDSSQVIRAASSQLYTYSYDGGPLRLVFDGDYFYDLYLNSIVCTETLGRMTALLDNEFRLNFAKTQVHSFEFRISMLKGISEEE